MKPYNKYKVSPKDQRTWQGRVYASKAECEFAKALDGEMRAGLIDEIVEQPIIHLGPIDYRPDFAVRKNKEWTWVDVKGVQTGEFKIKVKLWREMGPGTLLIVKRSGKGFKVTERVVAVKSQRRRRHERSRT